MKNFMNNKKSLVSGVYEIEPIPGKIVQTYCDFDRYGGGWTLMTKVKTSSDWTKDKALDFNSNDVKQIDYSIFGLIDNMKQLDAGEVFDTLFEVTRNKKATRLCVW